MNVYAVPSVVLQHPILVQDSTSYSKTKLPFASLKVVKTPDPVPRKLVMPPKSPLSICFCLLVEMEDLTELKVVNPFVISASSRVAANLGMAMAESIL